MPKEILNISNLAQGGLNTDIIPWELPPHVFNKAVNIRLTDGKIVPFADERHWLHSPDGLHIGYLAALKTLDGTVWVAPAREGIWALINSIWYDLLLPATNMGEDAEDLWHHCMLSRTPIFNHPDWFPVYWFPQQASTPVTDLPFKQKDDPDSTPEDPLPKIPVTWQESGERCRLMRSHRQWLIAMDLTTKVFGPTVDHLPDGVRWSTPADIGAVPESWDHLDVTNTAGLTQLGGDGGDIVDGLTLRDGFVIYRQFGVTVMDYIPGSPLVFQIRHMSTTYGVLAPDSIVEVKGKHYFMADGDIFVNDGNSIVSIAHHRIRKNLRDAYNPDTFSKAFTVTNPLESEIWFFIPTGEDKSPGSVIMYNWRDNTFAPRTIPETPFAAYGNTKFTKRIWSANINTWNSDPSTWNAGNVSPDHNQMVAVVKPGVAGNGTSGDLRFLDGVLDKESDVVRQAYILREGIALAGLNRVTTVTTVYPHARGPGKFWIQLGSMDWPGAPIRWKPAVLFNPETDRKVDIRTTGELHCYKIYDDNVQNSWELSSMDFEYTLAGLR